MGHKTRKIDWSTDLRTNRISYTHFMLHFWHRSGAGSNRLSKTKDNNIRAFGQFLKDSYDAKGKDSYVGPPGLLNILHERYKKFLTTHPEIEGESSKSLWREIIDMINEGVDDVRYSTGLYALLIIQETTSSIDHLFLVNQIYDRNKKFTDELSVSSLGFKREEIIKIINDPFVSQKIEERNSTKAKQ